MMASAICERQEFPVHKNKTFFIIYLLVCGRNKNYPLVNDYAVSSALVSHEVTSAGVGILPVETIFSLITKPGVDMTLYFMISGYSVTLMTSACKVISSTTLCTICSTRLQLAQPEPNTLIVNMFSPVTK
jgi:hypothetical protein